MVSSLAALLVASALVPSALAFADTAPFVAWSTSDLPSLSALSSSGPVVESSSAYAVLEDASLCSLEGVLVMDVQGLHSSDMANIYALPPQFANAAAKVDYLVSPSARDLDDALLRLAKQCSSVVQTTSEGETTPAKTDAAVVQIVKTDVAADAGSDDPHHNLARGLLSFLTTYPSSHLILLTGHPSPPPPSSAPASGDAPTTPLQVQRRQESPLLATPPHAAAQQSAAPSSSSSHRPNGNGTRGNEAELPLLARYQILSTPLLTCLIVAFGLLLPLLMLGINALNSIQVPERMTATKGIIVTEGKKNQ